MSATKKLLSLAACAATVALAGCGPQYDPLTRSGLWNPEHVNRANLVLMAANPSDLVRGSGETGSDGQMAAAAIDRLHTNKLKKLPDAGLSEVRVSSQGGGE